MLASPGSADGHHTDGTRSDSTFERELPSLRMPAITELCAQSPTLEVAVNGMTSHGPAAQEAAFTMPREALPVLNPADEFAAHQEDAAWLQFMGAQLTPKMTE